MDRVRTADVVLTPALAIGNAAPLSREGLGYKEEGETVGEGLRRLFEDSKFNELIDKTSGGVELFRSHVRVGNEARHGFLEKVH
jgi:hypothetical protein